MAGLKGIPATYGGIERAVEEIGARLVERGHDVTVFCRTHYTPAGTTRQRGMRLIRLPSLRTRALDTLSHTLLSGLCALPQRYDIVHLHSLGNAPFIPLFRIGRPVVFTLHGLESVQAKWEGAGQSYFQRCERPAVTLPDAVTSVSRPQGEELAARHRREIRVIPNGVAPMSPGSPEPLRALGLSSRNYLLFMARLVPEKGAHHLIEAYRGLTTEMPLVIAGDAPPRDAYASRLRELAAPDPRILFTGYAFGDLWRALLSHAYLCVHPSESEGLSLGLLESMAFGNGVLVSDVPENLDVVGEDAAARFRSRDTADLRGRLSGLIAAPAEVERLRGLAAARVLRHFAWDRIVDAYEEVYRQARGRRG